MPKINNHRLDKIDRKLLTAIETDARMPISELARQARVSRTVAEYRLQRFEEDGIIRGYYCLLDPSKFGLTVWKLWVSLSASSEEKEKFFQYIRHHPTMWWYAQCAGVYDAVLCVLSRTPHEFNTFFNEFQNNFGQIITETAILINVSFEYHSRGHLLKKRSRLIGTSFQEKPLVKKIPKQATGLLKLLSQNSRMSYAMMAEKTGKDARTIKNMIKELQDAGVIVYSRPSIDVSVIGYEYYKILLYLHNPKGGILPSVVEWCRGQQNIIAVISCVGPWQLELEIEIDTFRNLCKLLAELRDKFPELIKTYETLLITQEGNYELDLMDKVLRLGNL